MPVTVVGIHRYQALALFKLCPCEVTAGMLLLRARRSARANPRMTVVRLLAMLVAVPLCDAGAGVGITGLAPFTSQTSASLRIRFAVDSRAAWCAPGPLPTACACAQPRRGWQ